MGGMRIHCPHDSLVSVTELKPHPKNRNAHPRDQIKRLAKILEYQGWRYPIKVSKLSGYITSGHGRLEAAKLLKLKEVPVSFQDYSDEAQEYADLQSDNSIASWAELDLAGINADIVDLGPDFDLDLLGIKDFAVDVADLESPEETYTTKIESPVYTPKGERPTTAQLYDLEKTMGLLKRIGEKELPEDVKMFLQFAAHRHIVFDYEQIAEFYAHATKDVQELMEESALVIIDFQKAIASGFVEMTNDLAALYDSEITG